MIFPLITLLKIIALGSIKLIFLLLGIAFFPIYALRLILGGATSMLVPTLAWLLEHERLSQERHDAIMDDLDTLTKVDFTRKEARLLLWKMVKKMISNMRDSIANSYRWTANKIRNLIR